MYEVGDKSSYLIIHKTTGGVGDVDLSPLKNCREKHQADDLMSQKKNLWLHVMFSLSRFVDEIPSVF
jgi:hypothetical protein